MSDLTREEIRAACEAVGFPEPLSDDEFELDPIILLDATGGDYEIHRNRSGWRVRWWSEPWPKDFEPTLQAAAVRAVNAWAESRGRKAP